MDKDMGEIFKSERKKCGKSVKEVCKYLKGFGVEISPNAVYNWENNTSQPTSYVFLLVCRLYGITNVLDTFGYTDTKNEQLAQLNNNYKSLNQEGKEKLLDYSDDLVQSDRYKRKTNAPHIPDMDKIKKQIEPIAEQLYKNQRVPTKK